MVRNLVVLLVIFAAGYGYWYRSAQEGVDPRVVEQEELEENARRMQQCIDREDSMNAAAGLEGAGGMAGDARELCAEKLGLYFAEGQWRELGVYAESNFWD